MKLYSETGEFKLYHGSMLDMVNVIAPGSIDSVVTDPPYELNFMNKGWDNSGIAFQASTWRQCYTVLKPGGYLLAFGGSRTFHRIACAIEDAGFEIRDTIMWLYGCLSEDTEVLTQTGFKQFHKITNDDIIRVYDIENGVYKWEKPERWSVYTLDKDTCYRIKSDSTDQLVSRNHRCLIERDGKLVFEYAENLSRMERVPVLSYDIPYLQKGDRDILLTDLLWQGEGLAKDVFSERQGKEKPEEKSLWREQPLLERWCNLSEQERQLFISKNKVRKVSEEVYLNGEKRRVCNGTQTISGAADQQTAIKNGNSTSCQSQCGGQQAGELDVIRVEQGTQNVRGWTPYTTSLATVTEEEYTGIVFCPTVSTGCFVARRNGKVFITGNSGFPKSMNIGLAIDRRNGVEIVSDYVPNFKNAVYGSAMGGGNVAAGHKAQDAQNEWNGWGTQLKPAYEPVIVARKPCEGSCIDNVLRYGVGGINIDECRVGDELIKGGTVPVMGSGEQGVCNLKTRNASSPACEDHYGRFPANVILTYDDTDFNEVCGGMPETKSTGGCGESTRKTKFGFSDENKTGWGENQNRAHLGGLGDEGSAARYYYCAKASKRDRDEGLEQFEDRTLAFSNRAQAELKRGNVEENLKAGGMNSIKVRKNTHPTVKPTELMQYLVRLVTPKGGIVLDPFNGSGSTGKATMYENRDRDAGYKYIGIELTEEYLPIADARIRYAMGDTSPVEYMEMPKNSSEQISIFDLMED